MITLKIHDFEFALQRDGSFKAGLLSLKPYVKRVDYSGGLDPLEEIVSWKLSTEWNSTDGTLDYIEENMEEFLNETDELIESRIKDLTSKRDFLKGNTPIPPKSNNG